MIPTRLVEETIMHFKGEYKEIVCIRNHWELDSSGKASCPWSKGRQGGKECAIKAQECGDIQSCGGKKQ